MSNTLPAKNKRPASSKQFSEALKPPQAAQSLRLSVCICTRNRPDFLRACLESIAGGDRLPLEAIVSDDSPDPQATEAVCREFEFARHVRGPQRGLCANRNSAVQASLGNYLTFLDDDALLAPDFVRLAADLVASAAPTVMFTGDLLEGEERQRLTPTNPGFWGHFGAAPQGAYQTIHINCNLIPRAAFETVAFDENLIYGYDEMDICAQLLAAGYIIDYQPQLLNRHLPPQKTASVRARETQLAEGARFYTSLKRYWVLQHRPLKAAAYVLLAPLHRTAFDVKMKQWQDIPRSFSDMARALRLLMH